MTLEELDRQLLWHPFTQMAEWDPLVIDHGDGNYLVDINGRRYLDGVSSLWCNIHGHRHPRLDEAVRSQLERIAHSTFLGLTHEPGIRLAAALLDVVPSNLRRVFYSDSGSAAVEIALKQSFQYWQLVGRPTKQRFLRLGDAYHGDTLGAVGVGGIELFHRIFGPLLVRSLPVSSPASTDGATSLDEIEKTLSASSSEIAAFVLEPRIQGAAGMLVHPPGFLARVSELCRQYEVHLIVDEVATGFGRTGSMFACESEHVRPDFLCLAKGITGGYLPLAATLSTEEIFEAFLGRREELKQFFHGHTYTANPLACAVGISSLELLRKSTLDNGQSMIPELTVALEALRSHRLVKEIRQVGLMVGLELVAGSPLLGAEVCKAARANGVILRPLGNVVVWMPPLTITRDDVALLQRATHLAIDDVSRFT